MGPKWGGHAVEHMLANVSSIYKVWFVRIRSVVLSLRSEEGAGAFSVYFFGQGGYENCSLCVNPPRCIHRHSFSRVIRRGCGGPLSGGGRLNPVLGLQIHGSKLSPGEPVRVTLEVTNRSPETVRLTFLTGQRFDLSLRNVSGREVWRWSDGRLFMQALGEEVLKPSPGVLRFDATIPAPRGEGRYTLHGKITATNLTLRASAPFQVR